MLLIFSEAAEEKIQKHLLYCNFVFQFLLSFTLSFAYERQQILSL
jgi:hypothetical protein